MGARQPRRGALAWGEGAGAAQVGYSWQPLARVLALNFRTAGVSVTQRIQITHAPTPFGGRRAWFVCPDTLLRTRALYLPAGRRRWAGRVAHALTYASQASRPCAFTRFARDLDRGERAKRRNRVRALRRRERAIEAHRR